MEVQFVLAVDLAQLVFGQPEIGEPVDEVGREHLGLAVERITGEPDQLLLGEADRAGMIELGAQFALVDDFGKPDMAAAVDDREGDLLVRIEFPDHLQHQQLVEIGIEQAAHDRIEPPAMIVGSGRDVGNCHDGTLACRERRQPVPFRPGMAASARNPQPGLARRPPRTPVQAGFPGANCCRRKVTSSASWSVAHAVLEGGHVAEVAGRRRRDAVQDHLDQIVRARRCADCCSAPATAGCRTAARRRPHGRPRRRLHRAARRRGDAANHPGGGRLLEFGGERVLRRLVRSRLR